MKTKIYVMLLFTALIVIGPMNAQGLVTTKPSIEGRASVADEGVLPKGLYAKSSLFLPGDSVSVTNPATGITLNVMILGPAESSNGTAIQLSPEAAVRLFIAKGTETLVSMTKRVAPPNPSSSAVSPPFRRTVDPDRYPEDAIPSSLGAKLADATLPPADDAPLGADDIRPDPRPPATAKIDNVRAGTAIESAKTPDVWSAPYTELAKTDDVRPTPYRESGKAADVLPAPYNEPGKTTDVWPSPYRDLAKTDDVRPDPYRESGKAADVLPAPYNEPGKTTGVWPSPYGDFAKTDDVRPDPYRESGKAADVLPAPYNEPGKTADIWPNPYRDLAKTDDVRPDPYRESGKAVDVLPAPYNDLEKTDNVRTVPYKEPAKTPYVQSVPPKNPPKIDTVRPSSDRDAIKAAEPDSPKIVDEGGSEKTVVGVNPTSLNPPPQSFTPDPPAFTPAPQPPSAPKPRLNDLVVLENNLTRGFYYVQIATMSDERNIDFLLSKYRDRYNFALVPSRANAAAYRVMVGPLTADEYGVVLNRFQGSGYGDAFVKKIQ